MSGPVSARASCAVTRPQPGIDSAWASCSSQGASSSSFTAVRRAVSALIRSMSSSITASSPACAGGEELRALQRLFQLRDLAAGSAAARAASARTSRSPAISRLMMSRHHEGAGGASFKPSQW
jgi:hypothetical protein